MILPLHTAYLLGIVIFNMGKALAGTALDVLEREGLLGDVKREWEEGPGRRDEEMSL